VPRQPAGLGPGGGSKAPGDILEPSTSPRLNSKSTQHLKPEAARSHGRGETRCARCARCARWAHWPQASAEGPPAGTAPQVAVRRLEQRHHVLQQHRLQLPVVRLLLLQCRGAEAQGSEARCTAGRAGRDCSYAAAQLQSQAIKACGQYECASGGERPSPPSFSPSPNHSGHYPQTHPNT
jgi:hypothetical protein